MQNKMDISNLLSFLQEKRNIYCSGSEVLGICKLIDNYMKINTPDPDSIKSNLKEIFKETPSFYYYDNNTEGCYNYITLFGLLSFNIFCIYNIYIDSTDGKFKILKTNMDFSKYVNDIRLESNRINKNLPSLIKDSNISYYNINDIYNELNNEETILLLRNYINKTDYEGKCLRDCMKFSDKNNCDDKDIDQKGENNMLNNNIFPSLNIGKIDDYKIKISHLGIAVKNEQAIFVSYDPEENKLVDVDALSFEGKDMLMHMPVQVSKLETGDVILHNNSYYYIKENKNNLIGINYHSGLEETINITNNAFGFNFVTKVVSILDVASTKDTNLILQLILCANDRDNDMLQNVLMLQMAEDDSEDKGILDNPIILAMLMSKDTNTKSLLPLITLGMMGKQNKFSNLTKKPVKEENKDEQVEES